MVFKFATFDPAQDPDAFNPAFPPTPSPSPPATPCRPCKYTCTFTRALVSRLVAASTSLVLRAPGFELHDDEIRDGSAEIPLHSTNFDVRPQYHRRQLQEFTLKELTVATDKFSNKNVVGRGGFGRVYKGELADGSLVAIKRMGHGRYHGISEFEREVMIGSIIQPHHNLLPMLGFCRTPKSTDLLLVYPFMINRCLASCLGERKDDQPLLDWPTRRKVAVGAARGLSHLHDLSILHRDIKASNIMLDEEFEPHIGDFGLALLVDGRHGGYSVDGIEEAPRKKSKAGSDREFSYVTTAVIGTIGHIAPEYLSTGKCSVKNDVFAFGIMLLGLVTGERVFDRARLTVGEGVMLLDWVKAHVAERRWKILVDPYLQGAYDDEEIGEVTRLALLCTQLDARERPSMAQVVRTLEGHPTISIEERWEEYERRFWEENQRRLRLSEWFPPDTDRNVADSTSHIRADELSGPIIHERGSPETLMDPRGFAVKFCTREPRSANLKMYSLAELKSATRNFKRGMIGEGGFGKVFKGWVDERTLAPCKAGTGIPVAIKKSHPDSLQGWDEWQSEVKFLGKFSHPNLVRLLGHCWEDNQYLLVYEYVKRGSLENHLFRKRAEPLPWDMRLKIAIEAGRGVDFLHTSGENVIYRDFKTSNILLDADYNAKLSDFGLAKLGPASGISHVTTRVMGTYGYAAPEYIATGHLYVKSDVYGFGVVLLEMLTGLRAFDLTRPSGQHCLVEWARPLLHDEWKLRKIMDPRLKGQCPLKAATQAAKLTLKCLEGDPKARPSMDEVLVTLERINTTREKKEAKASKSSRASSHHHHHHNHHRSPIHQKSQC